MVLISYVPEFASALYGIASGQKIIVVLIGFQTIFFHYTIYTIRLHYILVINIYSSNYLLYLKSDFCTNAAKLIALIVTMIIQPVALKNFIITFCY